MPALKSLASPRFFFVCVAYHWVLPEDERHEQGFQPLKLVYVELISSINLLMILPTCQNSIHSYISVTVYTYNTILAYPSITLEGALHPVV